MAILAMLVAFALGGLLSACGDEDIHSLPEAQPLPAAPAAPPAPSRVLLVDDDEGLTGTDTWANALTTLGLVVDVDVVPLNGDPVLPLADYDVVVWSVGDRAYDNLTASNVALLTTYLDGGGRLLYSGGHSVYSETLPGASAFISAYLGLANYNLNMPLMANPGLPVSAVGTGHPAVGSDNYTMWYWAGGEYGDMFSGFDPGAASATGLLDHQPANLSPSAGFVGVANETASFKAITWGFDLNHVDPTLQLLLLGQTMTYLVN